MDLRIIHSAYDNDKYNYLSTFFSLCGFMVYNHIIGPSENCNVERNRAESVYEIKKCIAVLGDDDDSNNIIRWEAIPETIYIRCGHSIKGESGPNEIDFEGSRYNDMLMNLIPMLGLDEECTEQLTILCSMFYKNDFLKAQYCHFYAFCNNAVLEKMLWKYVDFYSELSSHAEGHINKSHFVYASVYLRYLICDLCDKINYVRPFRLERMFDECKALIAENVMSEGTNYLCAKLCELDSAKSIYAYEYYLESLICSAINDGQRDFLSKLKIGENGQLSVEVMGLIDDDLWRGSLIDSKLPNNYLAAYGMGDTCLKYNNAENLALICFRMAMKVNNMHYRSLYKKAICKYNMNKENDSLHCFESVYYALKWLADKELCQPKEMAYLLKSSRNIDKIELKQDNSKHSLHDEAQALCMKNSENAMIRSIIDSFSTKDIKSEDLVDELYDGVVQKFL